MAKEEFINAGYKVVGTENSENKLLSFLKDNYPNIIRDTEINLQELKNVLGLPIDEKVNGYGLNFVGRNFAKGKYEQKTERELRLNTSFSKDIDTTQNLVLKGDNLDTLKILKNHYSGLVKCIYIDPPYNTDKDEFVYPDKFDKEEAEVLGLANLSESDFERMDFSFKTKKSHNGWLAFIYPRLLLARDLLSKDGVIFISIDDNEQANLKLLCDEVFGEENLVGNIVWNNVTDNNPSNIAIEHEYILCYCKEKTRLTPFWKSNISEIKDLLIKVGDEFTSKHQSQAELQATYSKWFRENKNQLWPLENYKFIDKDGIYSGERGVHNPGKEGYRYDIIHPITKKPCKQPLMGYRFPEVTMKKMIEEGKIIFGDDEDKLVEIKVYAKDYLQKLSSVLQLDGRTGTNEVKELFPEVKKVFTNPKTVKLLKDLISYACNQSDLILDFFAGSGTTGDSVMQLNAEDGGNRKFILCQKDEQIEKKKDAYDFCIENNLAPVISSITIERLKRAGEKITKDVEAENSKSGMFKEHKKKAPDVGFKVFDIVEAPKLKVDEKGQISITENETDALSRIYNMIFTVGLDEPTQVPDFVVENCIYKIGSHYYITNSKKINSDDYANAIKNGKVFIDGWTASLNGTLQNYKEDVKIVF
jgi:adenine-specific DNA-methyltransferase